MITSLVFLSICKIYEEHNNNPALALPSAVRAACMASDVSYHSVIHQKAEQKSFKAYFILTVMGFLFHN